MSDFSDDDFGDFQEATHSDNPPKSEVEEEINVAEEEENIKILETFPTIELDLLTDLLDDKNLWSIEQQEGTSEEFNNDNLFDLFSYFNEIDLTSTDTLFPDNVKEAIEIWQSLRVVEETNALKFRWSCSQLYSYFIKALSLYGSQQSDSSKLNVSKTNFLANDAFTVDSAIDENNTPSCSNEQTYSSNTLDCDFFQSDSVQNNGPSLLEQELNSLGLSGLSKIQTPKTSHPVVVNGTSHKPTKPSLCYLSASELNDEAQSFYERMPDLNFMLFDRVTR